MSIKLSSENHLYELPDDLIMNIFKIYIQNEIYLQSSSFKKSLKMNVNLKSFSISSYIMKICAISKHFSEIVKCNIDKLFKPEDYIFCNYMFAQVITMNTY